MVGKKSLNLVHMVDDLNSLHSAVDSNFSIEIPRGIVFPMGSFSRIYGDNDWLRQALKQLIERSVDETEIEEFMKGVREKIMEKPLTPETEGTMRTVIHKLIPTENGITEEYVEQAWNSLKQCWASMFAPRPYSALNKIDDVELSYERLDMAVLVQPVFDAEYAFVVHTADPCGKPGLVGELVIGLGEVLVNSEPGGSLKWRFDEGEVKVESFQSKSEAVFTPPANLIFRSDSNCEDRSGFAGAGLFESIPVKPFARRHLQSKTSRGERETTQVSRIISYMDQRDNRSRLLKTVSEVSHRIKDLFQKDMDIEGCLRVCHDNRVVVAIVQARPQV